MKRTFDELRVLILRELSRGSRTINQLSVETGINWRTVSAHLDFLAAEGSVAEIVSSEYVRIFGITRHGIEKLGVKQKHTEEKKIEVKVAGEADIMKVEIT